MGRSSFEIWFYTRKDTGKRLGKQLLMARISVNGMKASQMSLQQSVTPAIWNQKCGRAEGNSVEASELNSILKWKKRINCPLKNGVRCPPKVEA